MVAHYHTGAMRVEVFRDRALFLAVMLAAGGLLAPAAPAHAATALEAQQQETELKRIRERIQALARAVEDDRAQHDKLTQQLHETEVSISELSGNLRKLNKQIAGQDDTVATTQREKDIVLKKLDAEREALRRQVRAAYLMGRQQQAKLLLNQEDPARLGRVLTYYDYLNRERVRQIGKIREQLDRLQQIEGSLRGQLADLLKLQEERRQGLGQLQVTRQTRRATLSEIKSRIQTQDREIARLRSTESRTSQLLGTMQQALLDLPLDLGGNRPFPQLKGKLPWPTRGRLLASFGQPKAGGRLSWRGIWISAPTGSAVQSVARGRVVYVGWMHLYGLIVVVEHGNNYFSLYGHNQNALVNAGQSVQAGQVLANAGESGGHEQSGVYFEIRNGKNPVNPRQWLRP
jgi:septal ring factor EnvC (AmiA/AmiB activator)